MQENKDRLYQKEHASIDGFRFDAKVANVFDDMIRRSVPGYSQILALIPSLVRQSLKDNVRGSYYDLGCSLGAGMVSLAQGLSLETEKNNKPRVVGIDNSQAMLEQANTKLEGLDSHYGVDFCLIHDDIASTPIDQAAMILMNFTLQFLPTGERAGLIKRCYEGLNTGGRLVLSEKIKFDDSKTDQALIEIHHQFKQDQGYSELEISQKRDAIENVLIPETLTTHTKRLKSVGFEIVIPWIQNLQFISILAIK